MSDDYEEDAYWAAIHQARWDIEIGTERMRAEVMASIIEMAKLARIECGLPPYHCPECGHSMCRDPQCDGIPF